MVKIRFILLFVVLCMVLSGCSTQAYTEPTDSNTLETTTVPILPTTEPLVFDPWNPATYTMEDIISITEVEDEWPESRTWKIDFKSAGVNVFGYVSVPNKCLEEKVPYSCVVYNRGGNPNLGTLTIRETSGYALTFDSVVIAVELRGTFSGTGKYAYGSADEVGDIRKLIDFCEEFAFVDMDRLYMMGISNGGKMTYMTIREDERVKKAFVFSGTADVFLSFESRYDMRGLLYSWIGGTPQSKPEEYEKRSATYWADELKCPVLIFHSKKDERVAYEQATKLVAALEKAGKEYKFVSYDDDVHGPHNGDREIIMDWCDFGPKVS